MAQILVTTPDVGSYPIHIETGLLSHLPVDELRPAVVISNETVAPLHAHYFADCPALTMRDGEQFKNLDTVRDLYSGMVRAGADRGTRVIALGGGVVGDTAGFVAATYMRGVALVQVPTTLLSMVDSSVGAKVGVDLPEGKNLVGVFKQPESVLIDPAVLDTLPEDGWRHGMAEVIKHGLIADAELLNPDLWSRDRAEELVIRAVQVKVDVVQRDPYEHGERAHLNLGHTFAHAIEQVSGYAWAHGDAVGLGVLAAARLSRRLGMCDAVLVEQVEDVVARLGYPQRLNGLDPELILAAMKTDKKWRKGRSHFILLRGVEQPESVYDVDNEAVIAVLQELR